MDISDPAEPVVTEAVQDENFAFWHSATFADDTNNVIFTDALGGGGAPICTEEIGHFDRGPWDPDQLTTAGSWSACYYKGHGCSSDIQQELDVLRSTDEHTQGEEGIVMDEFDPQFQPVLVQG